MNEYWDKRTRLLEAIHDRGYCTPISNLCGDIFALGNSLSRIMTELDENGLITKVKDKFVMTYLTAKGERALAALIELGSIWKK